MSVRDHELVSAESKRALGYLSRRTRGTSLRTILLLAVAATSSQLVWIISPVTTVSPLSPATHTLAPSNTTLLPPYVGRVCLVQGESNACPQTIPHMTADSGGHLNVSVNILGSPSFNTSGISLHWDPTIMNASGVDLANTIIPNFNVSAICINGSGFGCGSHDGPGVAHVDIVGGNTSAPSSGRLFKLSLVGSPRVDPHIGFATGCSTVSVVNLSAPGSVPNTNLCVIVGFLKTNCAMVCSSTLTPDPEEVQSQSFGVHLPTPLATVIPSGNITGSVSAGGAPNYADTWVMPYAITLPGNITGWKAQFHPGVLNLTISIPPTPIGVQLKVLRETSPGILTVVEAGPVHDPRPVLSSRLPSWPFVPTEWTVIPYYTDGLLTVSPGDFIGLTLMSNSTLGAYIYPTVNATGSARFVTRNVPVSGTINLMGNFTGTLPGFAPAMDLTVQPSPAPLDTAGDGIPDFVALSPEMRALNVDPCRKTVLVQLDYMQPAQGLVTFKPLQQALDMVTAGFDAAPVSAVSNCPYQGFPAKPSGVKLVLDVRNAIPEQDALSFTHSEPLSFDTVKAAFFDTNRADYFHYGLFINQTATGDTTSGVGEVYGNDLIISLGGWTFGVGSVSEQAGTLMHEIGHNLGLEHGGNDTVNRKPNYLSVMSYEYQVVGIITKTPTGNVTRFDYSRERMPTLNETSLDEWTVLSTANDYTSWVCPNHHTVEKDLVDHPLDWNCDGMLSRGTVNDVNNDTVKGVLNGFDDWPNLRYKFTQSDNFNIGCRINCDIGCRINCDIGCRINCDIGCKLGCDIGCRIGCAFGQELDRQTALVIEASWAAFLSAPHRSTSTSVSCVPASVPVNSPSACTASVSDVDPGTPTAPNGTVSFKSSQPGTFTPTACSLASTGAATASCTVNYSPAGSSFGPQTITAGYTGDTNHIGSSGTTTVNGLSFAVSTFFTDATGAPLPLDSHGNPKVDVILSNGKVKSTNPGQIVAWAEGTSIGGPALQSLRLNEVFPVDWSVHPSWMPAQGAIQVFFVFANGTRLDITNQTSLTVTTGNPERLSLVIVSLAATLAGTSLSPGDSILVSAKLGYGLVGTAQTPLSYPRNYTNTANATAWTLPSFMGGQVSGSASARFIAYAKVLGDLDGDFKVDIVDAAIVAYAYGSRPGDARWTPAADLNNDGVVDIQDAALVAFYFGTHA